MLATALAKANTAVQLDNTQSHDFARKYYLEACVLLLQLIHRTTNEADKAKLRSIRYTYLRRVEELGGSIAEES
ncbi:hypothetical protein GGS23DRAFT_595963 [Durotheca rogersii]|uniref:uncharacterized protein n=1 Tax=Durotheca rogersii TaxID=419775 RepID=UPI00221FF84F|nr:uncharacterized protein GGS23DRAFT_595963 [Durotheca rogersii]KAI5864330.1 hypothetical protein GGS23DRAFT_595963 [Durotheca rogersii]